MNFQKSKSKRIKGIIVLLFQTSLFICLSLLPVTAFAGLNNPASPVKPGATPVGTFVLTGTQLIDTTGQCSSVSVTVTGSVTGTVNDGGGNDQVTFELWDDGTLKDSESISVPVGQTISFAITMGFDGLYGTLAAGVGVYCYELNLTEDPFYPTDQSGTCGGILSISPSSRSVANTPGTTTFNVSNTGTGTMPWAAAVISGETWLSISSGAFGTDTGTINCAFTANTTASPRTGTIRVTAPGAASGNPTDVTVIQAGSSVVGLTGSFCRIGIWVYNSESATWTQITSENPENMIYCGSSLYADYGGFGLWKWNGSSWTQIAEVNAENMVASGSNLYVDFGYDYGIWKWDGSVWLQLTLINAENMVVSDSALYVDFGASYGVYRYDGNWTKLTNGTPMMMVTPR